MGTSYEKWMADRIYKEIGYKELSPETLKLYQLKKLKDTINTALKSKFYGEILKDISNDKLNDFDDFKKLPFTTSQELCNKPKDFLCVPIDRISRVVTLKTSGTTGSPRRVFFTEDDLKKTIEFFRYGMLNLVTTGERVLILMPGNATASIGALLKEGLNQAGCDAIIYGPVMDNFHALESIKLSHIDCIVGLPTQVYHLAKLKNNDTRYSGIKLKSILLSADYVPRSLCRTVSDEFDCPVFTHYGMTEMGYGGGIECSSLNGYHMRDVDLYTEIIDPFTGLDVYEGNYGEIVFTTLSTEGMPLIRYRTGDISRFLPNACLCSSALKRMDYVKGRLADYVRLKDGSYLNIGMIDEIMYKIPNMLDYKAFITEGKETVINLGIKLVLPELPINFSEIEKSMKNDKYLGPLLEDNIISLSFNGNLENIEISNGMVKRKLYRETL